MAKQSKATGGERGAGCRSLAAGGAAGIPPPHKMTHKPPPRWTTGRPALSGRPASARPACLPAALWALSGKPAWSVRADDGRRRTDREVHADEQSQSQSQSRAGAMFGWLAGLCVPTRPLRAACCSAGRPASGRDQRMDGWAAAAVANARALPFWAKSRRRQWHRHMRQEQHPYMFIY
jgi:hypothetical protein